MILARDRVFQRVRTDILNCELKPGEELREADLAKRYGVSKTPIRVAMQKLEFEGLVDIKPRRGHRVRPISIRDAEDILELRAILESAVVGKIARTASAEDLASLDLMRLPDVESVQSFVEYNRGFHAALAAMSGNLRLAEETVRVMEFYDRLAIVSLTLYSREGGFDGPLADHNAIIDALQARNGRLAGRLVREHVERSRAQIMRGLIRQPVIA